MHSGGVACTRNAGSLQHRLFQGHFYCVLGAVCDFLTLNTLNRTKKSREGMTWGINHSGFNCKINTPRKSWVIQWLCLLDQLWSQLKLSEERLSCPDFLFIHLHDNETIAGPLSYCQAPRMLRACIANADLEQSLGDELNSYTMHSAKSTLLSRAAQKTVPAEVRVCQSHHTLCTAFRSLAGTTYIQLKVATADLQFNS